jgi:hypothetical protein
VSVRDFKSCGPAYGRPVGSIPTHFRQLIAAISGQWSVASDWLLAISHSFMKKRKPFKRTTEVKRQARLRVGSPPAVQTHQDRRKKLPKHKKRERQEVAEDRAIG